MIHFPGTNLTDRFHDQFSALLINQNIPWLKSDSTVIRLPLSSEYTKDGIEFGLKRISLLFDTFLQHASRTILFLNSVMQVPVVSDIDQARTMPCRLPFRTRGLLSFALYFYIYIYICGYLYICPFS